MNCMSLHSSSHGTLCVCVHVHVHVCTALWQMEERSLARFFLWLSF